MAFVDSDDCVSPDYIQSLMTALVSADADIAICDYYAYSAGRSTPISHIGNCDGVTTDEIKRRILSNGTPIVTAVYKKKIIVDNDLFFPENIFYEDNAVSPSFFLSARKIAKVNKPLYYVRVDNVSTMRSVNNPAFFDRLTTARMMLSHTKRLGYYNKFKDEIDESFFNLYYRGTVIGIYEKFSPVPFKKATEVKRHILSEFGCKKTLAHIRRKGLVDRMVLLSSLVSAHAGYFAFKAFRFISWLRHHNDK